MQGKHVDVRIKADVEFVNATVPEFFQGRAVYLCVFAETSDGHLVHFGRVRCGRYKARLSPLINASSAKKFGKRQEITFGARLTSSGQIVTCYVACEDLGNPTVS